MSRALTTVRAARASLARAAAAPTLTRPMTTLHDRERAAEAKYFNESEALLLRKLLAKMRADSPPTGPAVSAEAKALAAIVGAWVLQGKGERDGGGGPICRDAAPHCPSCVLLSSLRGSIISPPLHPSRPPRLPLSYTCTCTAPAPPSRRRQVQD